MYIQSMVKKKEHIHPIEALHCCNQYYSTVLFILCPVQKFYLHYQSICTNTQNFKVNIVIAF